MRRRLTIAIISVAAVSVGLFAIPLAFVAQRGYRNEELIRLQRDAVASARKTDLSASSGDPVELPSGSDKTAVYSVRGRRVAGVGPAAADAAVFEAVRTRRLADGTSPGQLVAAVPLLSGERITGAIRVQRSDRVAAERTERAWLMLGGGAAIIMLLAGAAAVLLGRRLAIPLERLARSARRLGDGDFSVRAPRGGISEVDDVAEAFDATAARLDELITKERSFTADASHQLRTPLAALRLELEAAQLDPTGADIDAAVDQVDRLQRTIDTLLAAARDTPASGATTDLGALLDELEAQWHGRLAADGRRMDIRKSDGEQLAGARPNVVREIVDVLIDNAFCHGAGVITVTLRDGDSWRAIDVADEGAGVTDDATKIFSRRVTPGDGHGIGLALAHSLAQAEGGRLTLTRAGPGPVFRLLLTA